MKRFISFLASMLVLCACDTHRNNYTVIISLDAFRWDYPESFDTPWLDTLATRGVSSTMLPSYPASTFPNHYTLATGLVPDHNGIVNNSFWDVENGVMYSMGDSLTRNNPDYYKGEPIWTTAERQGVRTANIYWVGSDIPVKGSFPSIYYKWEVPQRLTYPERADEVVRLLSLPEDERPRLVMCYFDEPDMTSHHFGPLSSEVGEMVHYLDSLVGVIYRGVEALPYRDKVNIIVTADHGMAELSPDRFVCMDDYLKEEWCEHVIGSNPTSIFSKPGCRDSILTALSGIEHISVWKKEDIPAELVYGSSDRIGDIIVAPDTGWQFAHTLRNAKGAHGYSPLDSDMQVAFVAAGPDFKHGFVNSDKFVNVDIYPLLAYLLGVKPEDTDGDFNRVKPLLR